MEKSDQVEFLMKLEIWIRKPEAKPLKSTKRRPSRFSKQIMLYQKQIVLLRVNRNQSEISMPTENRNPQLSLQNKIEPKNTK